MNSYFRERHDEIKLWNSSGPDYPPHFHDEIEVIFVYSGTATAYYNGTAYALHPGSIFFVSPNVIHAYQFRSSDYTHTLMIIDPKKLVGLFSKIDHNIPENPVWYEPERKSKVWNLITFAEEMQRNVSDDTLILLLSTIISIILENLEPSKIANSKQSIRLLSEYCRTHFREPLSLKSISEALHFSESYISHSFSNVLKISLPDYINGLRLNEAVRLLKNTKMNITEISIQSGFPTTRTFNRVFMKQYGVSPTQFRKNPIYK